MPSSPPAPSEVPSSAERTLAVVLRSMGLIDLCALFVVVLPGEWIAGIHRWLGLGTLPDAPIVGYLARSGSAMYALHGALVVYASYDVARYWPLIRFLALLALVHGAVMLEIDISQGLPLLWQLGEGPLFAASGALVLWLQARVVRPVARG